jgi:pilus assembly protein CpaB
MRMATIVSLGASAALGVGALVVARVWLPAQAPHSTQAVQAAVQPGVPVVIATSAINYGTRLEARYLTVVRMPSAAVPQGSYQTVAQLMNQPGGAPVAIQPISAHEPVLPTRLSGPGARATMAAEIGEGMRAYTIAVSDVLGGGGHILPGDRVDVVLTRDISGDSGENSGGGRRFVSSVVIQDTKVLGMDLNADPSSTHPAVAHTATLEVTLQDSVRLALAGQAGTLSLALRRTGSDEIVAQRPIALINPGARPHRDPAPAAAAAGPARPAVDPNRRSLVVSSGSTHTVVDVPADH